MPNNPNKLSQFWQELKRRKVIKVIAMYAGTAIVLIELANNVVEPLNLPDWTPRLVIILALIGFPIMIVLSWILDITPEGFSKTESIVELKDQELVAGPSKKRLKVSDVIIGILVILVGILLYPRIFGTPRLNAMTYPVTVVNEFGEKETHRVFKEDYLTQVQIFPFRNESRDSSKNWIQYGIQEAVWGDLRQFNYLAIGQDDDIILQEQIKSANTENYPHFLTGIFTTKNGTYEITSRLYQTASGLILAERNFRGSDFFMLMDSISMQARIDLNISDNLLNSIPDLPIKESYTDNFNAFRYFTIGCRIDSFFINLNKATKLDPTFALALYEKSRFNYHFQQSRESALKDINQAMIHRNRLLPHDEIGTRISYYLICGENEKAIALAEMERNLKPYDYLLLRRLANLYDSNFLIQKEEEALVELNELVPDRPHFQLWLADTYLFTGKLDKGQVIIEKLIKEDPRNTEALFALGEINLHKNDFGKAEEIYNRVRLINPEMQKYCSMMLDHCAYMREYQEKNLSHIPYTGNFIDESTEMTGINSILNDQLLARGDNQGAIFLYPISKNQYISQYIPGLGPAKFTFTANGDGKVIGLILEQGETYTNWKEDSLILKARDQLNNDHPNEALSIFRKAYDQNPEHYYLANYIQHLEFIQSPEYGKYKIAIKTYTGDYRSYKIFEEEGQLYYETNEGFIFKLLPLDVDLIMIPSSLYCLLQFEKENDNISGVRMTYRNGEDEFYPRSSKQAHANLGN